MVPAHREARLARAATAERRAARSAGSRIPPASGAAELLPGLSGARSGGRCGGPGAPRSGRGRARPRVSRTPPDPAHPRPSRSAGESRRSASVLPAAAGPLPVRRAPGNPRRRRCRGPAPRPCVRQPSGLESRHHSALERQRLSGSRPPADPSPRRGEHLLGAMGPSGRLAEPERGARAAGGSLPILHAAGSDHLRARPLRRSESPGGGRGGTPVLVGRSGGL